MFILSLFKQINLRRFIETIVQKLNGSTAECCHSAGWLQLIDNRGRIQSKTKLLERDSCTCVLAKNTKYIDISAFGKGKFWFDVTVISLLPLDGHNRNSYYQISAAKFKRINLNFFRKRGYLPLSIKVDYATSVEDMPS